MVPNGAGFGTFYSPHTLYDSDAMTALDTETAGLDLYHGAKPYLVTICEEDGTQRWWEWDVDPLTREPSIPQADLDEIRFLVENKLSDRLVGQNIKFDCAALRAVLPGLEWPWDDTDDTLIAGHLLHSAQKHDLTSMVMMWLGEDIEPFEKKLKDAVTECRRKVQQARLKIGRGKVTAEDEVLARWQIAERGRDDMPSAGAEPWKLDSWLPRAMAKHLKLSPGHPWMHVAAEYANADSAWTLLLFRKQLEEIKRRELEPLYRQRLKLLRPIADMERRGVTFSGVRAGELEHDFGARSAALRDDCMTVAEELGAELELPSGATPNASLRRFCFDVLKLPMRFSKKSKTDQATLDKDAMAYYRQTLDERTPAGRFVKALLDKRGFDTSLTYIQNYQRHGIALRKGMSFHVLHSSYNPTGSATLRWSCSNPNGQNISKRDPDDKTKGRTLRYLFGPAPGREWWSLDYENLELRIPAYASGDKNMIALFEHPNDPPYFGSNHLLVGSRVFPKQWKEHPGKAFKEKYKATCYQWTKNGNFAYQYGAGKGTTDASFHTEGAYEIVQRTFPEMAKLAAAHIAFAERHGYVVTLPDRDAGVGYPVECVRSEYGRINPTEPFNYWCQSTAVQAANKGILRCQPLLDEWSRGGQKHYITLYVHDELVFDFPLGGARNLPKVRALQAAMEQSGDDIGVPLKVSIAYHPHNWGETVDPRKETLNACA